MELFDSFFVLKYLMNVFIQKLAFKNVKSVTSGPVHLYFDLCMTVDSVTNTIIRSQLIWYVSDRKLDCFLCY